MARPKSTLVTLPADCGHGNRFTCFRAVQPGTIVYDPGCRHPKKIADMQAHYVGPNGLITLATWIKRYGREN